MIYRFGSFVLDREAFTLSDSGQPVHVEPQVFDLIVFITSNSGRVVTRDEIIDAVWDGRVVSDATVASCIKSARKAIGDNGSSQNFIRTVRGRGFQFLLDVEKTDAAAIQTVVSTSIESSQQVVPDPEEPQGTRPSIAVLPLQSLNPTDQYGALGDAISQEVILELARLHWLFVTARGSSFMFRGHDIDLKSVCEVLGVSYLVTGTLAIHESKSVVTIEVAQGSSGRLIWAERFEQPVEELLLLRATIAGRIVRAIETRIQITEAIEAGRLSTENLDAWSAYHRGLWHMYRFNPNDNAAAAKFFASAVETDPYFARAYAGLSFTHFQNAFLNYNADTAAHARLARSYAEKCYTLDPLDPFINLTMGRSNWIAGDIEAAIPWLSRSIELSPNYAFAIYNHALLNILQGEGEESDQNVSRAISLSPIDPLNYAMLGTRSMACIVRTEFEAGADWAQRAIMAPHAHYLIFSIAALANELSGRHELAVGCVEKLRRMKPDFELAHFFRGFPISNQALRKAVENAFGRLGIR